MRRSLGRNTTTLSEPPQRSVATSCSCSSAFFPEVLNHQSEPLIDREFLEDALAIKWIAHECCGNQVSKHFRITQIGKIPVYFRRKLPWAVSFEARIKFQHFRGERLSLHRGGPVRFKGVNHCDWDWFF